MAYSGLSTAQPPSGAGSTLARVGAGPAFLTVSRHEPTPGTDAGTKTILPGPSPRRPCRH